MTAEILKMVLTRQLLVFKPLLGTRYSVLGTQNIASETSFSRSMRRFHVEMLGTT